MTESRYLATLKVWRPESTVRVGNGRQGKVRWRQVRKGYVRRGLVLGWIWWLVGEDLLTVLWFRAVGERGGPSVGRPLGPGSIASLVRVPFRFTVVAEVRGATRPLALNLRAARAACSYHSKTETKCIHLSKHINLQYPLKSVHSACWTTEPINVNDSKLPIQIIQGENRFQIEK